MIQTLRDAGFAYAHLHAGAGPVENSELMRALQRQHEQLVAVLRRRELARSDYVSLHVPLTDETKGMVDERFLCAMKPTAYLINAARGAVIDQDALIAALSDGQLEDQTEVLCLCESIPELISFVP